MLDPRLYRAGFLPLLFVLVVVGFSLREKPAGRGSSLATQAFDGAAAQTTLRGLEASGSAVVARVANGLRSRGFVTSIRSFSGQTVHGPRRLETVVAERVGFSSRRIVVVAPRGTGGPAGLSGTAGLLELARVLGGRTLGRTLDLVSTSGAEGGAAARDLAAHLPGPVEAVLVLGDLGAARARKPWVVPFSSSAPRFAPLVLRATVEGAVRAETGQVPGGVHPFTQWARLALPLTLSDQGPFVSAGVPAVLLGPGGERGAPVREPASTAQLESFGRAALRTVSALDGAPPVGRPAAYLVVAHKVVPAWAIRLLVAALMFPALLASVDGFARVRRRRQGVAAWIGWVLAGVLPFALLALFLRALGAFGALPGAPPAPVPESALPLRGSGVAVLAGGAGVLLLAWFVLRPLLLRLGHRREKEPGTGAAAALLLVLGAAAVLAWVLNPFAAALLVPALHLWLLVLAPDLRLPWALRLALALLGLVPAALLALSYGSELGLGPLAELWTGTLLLAGGGLALPVALGISVVLGCFAGVLAVVLGSVRSGGRGEEVSVRGPVSYAGPGSLGGTKSALRR